MDFIDKEELLDILKQSVVELQQSMAFDADQQTVEYIRGLEDVIKTVDMLNTRKITDCKDCIHNVGEKTVAGKITAPYCNFHDMYVYPEYFCATGKERKKDG